MKQCLRTYPSSAATLVSVLSLTLAAPAHAQTIAPEFAGDYSFLNLGKPANVPGQGNRTKVAAGCQVTAPARPVP